MEILIAEDDFYSGKILQKILETSGHQPILAEDGLKAWELFQEREIRMVITDWMMPRMDGLDLCRKIRSSGRESYTYIIFLTAKDQKQDLIDVFEAGADDYTKKPLDPGEIRARIKTGERILSLEEGHREFQQILSESRNKLRIVFDSLQEEIVSIDENFRIVSANRAFIQNRDVAFEEVVGKPCFRFLQGEAVTPGENGIESSLRKTFESGKPQDLLDTSTDQHGEKKVKEIQCIPIRDESGRVFQTVMMSRDITDERRKSEKIRTLNKKLHGAVVQLRSKKEELEQTVGRLKDTQAQMLQSEKMASVGQLAAGVAHEINNPTGFVSSNLKTLSGYINDMDGVIKKYRQLRDEIKDKISEENLSSSVAEQVNQIVALEREIDIDFVMSDTPNLIEESQEGTERIKKIVMDLKDFAHPGEDKVQTADINKGIESTLNVVWNELKYKARVTKKYGDLPSVKCYPQQLNQVFMNLFVNAAQAIEGQGEIRIETRADNGYAEIRISDTGAGIPEENLSKIFDPFFTTKEVGKGTGLGLNVAYNIVKKHKGTIEVESEAGRGTTFVIRIPAGRE